MCLYVLWELTQGAAVCLQMAETGWVSSQGNNALILIRSQDATCKQTDGSTYGFMDADTSKNK